MRRVRSHRYTDPRRRQFLEQARELLGRTKLRKEGRLEVAVAEVSDRKNPRLLSGVVYSEPDGWLATRLDRPGVYQAFARPKDPWLLAACHTLCLSCAFLSVEG